jgi:hypothetical protein
MKTINLENLKEKTATFLKTTSKVALVIAALFIGAISRDIYLRVTTPKVVTPTLKFENPKTIGETSIAINERGELMVIDRKTGEYHLYQDSVGRTIFNMYAGRIYSQKIQE